MAIDKNYNEIQNFKEAAYIYVSGYSTGCGWTLETWFKAREIVRTNDVLMNKIIPEPKKEKEQ